jgi:PAS domain S-box-containing protein
MKDEKDAELRSRAVAHLTGNAAAVNARANPAAALGALYELSSSPATAGAALALLHELQVRQVEVELQGEELRRSRCDIEARLARYVQLHDLAPFAYFTVDAGTAIYELNLAGARLLGSDRDSLLGSRLEPLLMPQSGAALHALLANARNGTAPRAVTGYLRAYGAERPLHICAKADALDGRFLVAMMDSTDTTA